MKVKIILFSLITVLLLSAVGVGMYAALPYRYDNAEEYQKGNASMQATSVDTVQIHWINGFITLETYDGDTLQIHETEGDKAVSDQQMYSRVKDGTLDIRYCQSGVLSKGTRKQLTVLVPKDKTIHLNVTTQTANIIVSNQTLGNVTIENATGLTRFYRTSVQSIQCTTDSGEVNFSGSMESGTFATDSGSHTLSSLVTPKTLQFHSVDGTMDLTLPKDAAFTADFYTKDGSLTSAFDGTIDQNRLTVGTDPTAAFEIVTVSGNLKINK